MKEGGPRNLTLALGTAVLLGLFLGGATYVRTATNQERLKERNFRELARIARSVEGQVNNLERIVQSLARTRQDSLEYAFEDRSIAREYDANEKATLIPFLTLADPGSKTACSAAATTDPLVDLGRGTIRLCHTAVRIRESRKPLRASIRASWSLEALRVTLEADYFDAVLIADDSGRVLLASSKASGVRVRDLPPPSLDSASTASAPGGARREGVSSIRRDTIGGREYHLFLQPIGIQVFDRRIDWTVAGLAPVADLRRESVALGPTTALFLMLFVVIGLLLAPFVRVLSMGPRERMEVRDVFLLLASLVLASGLFGLLLADLAHYWRLRDALYEQADSVAQQLAGNLDSEVQTVLADLDSLSDAFSDTMRGLDSLSDAWTHQDTADLSHRLKTGLDTLFSYPARDMVFWTNPDGQQVAKWTPRPTNTSRVEVNQRDYFTRIRASRGWPRHSRSPKGAGPTGGSDLATSDTASSDGEYYLESIRSSTTGEHLAALSRSFCWTGSWNNTRCPPDRLGISVAITKLVTLDRPILPSGFEFAVVEADGKTLFHSRPERNLEEDFVEETGHNKLLRSVLEAGTSRHLDATYGGRRSRLFVQPLSQRPISVIIVLDKAQLETLHFEAWFVGTVLLAVYALLLLVWLVVIEKATARRMHWVWPDREDPKKHSLVLVIFGLFGGMLVLQIALAESFPASIGSFLIPFQALGLGLVVLSSGDKESRSNRTATRLGWGLATVATLLVLGSVWFLSDQTPATQLPAILVFVIHIAVSVLAGGLALSVTVRGRSTGEPSEPVCGVTRAYTASMVVAVLVVGVLPGYLFYQLVFGEHLELLVRHQQVQLADALIDREVRLDSLIELYGNGIRSDSFDLSFQRLFESCYWIRRDSVPYSDCFAGSAMLRSSRIVEEPLTHGLLHSTLSDRVPWLTDVSESWRQLAEPQTDRQWRRPSSGGWTRPRARFETRWLLALGRLPNEPRIVIRSSFPTGLWRPTHWWAFASTGALVLIVLLVRWLSRRVFLINLGQTKPVSLEEVLSEKAPRSLIVVCTRSTDREPLIKRDKKELHYVNLMAVEIDAGGTPRLPEAAEGMQRVCFDYFDHRFQEPEWNQRLLGHLEKLVYEKKKKKEVLLVSSRDPYDLIQELAAADDPAEPYRRRWARLLGQFARVSVADEVSPAADFETPRDTTRPELYSVLRRECNGRGKLQEIGRQVLSRSDFLELTPDALVDHIRDAADSHYTALWAVLGEEEQLVVAQLAAGAVANPRCGRSVRLLLCRELIERGPELRLMNSSFGRFVRETVSRSTVRDWERGEHPSTWQLIRIPFVVGLLALAVFLAYAEPGAFGKGMAFLGTTIAGLATVARILTLYQKGPADAGVAATR